MLLKNAELKASSKKFFIFHYIQGFIPNLLVSQYSRIYCERNLQSVFVFGKVVSKNEPFFYF